MIDVIIFLLALYFSHKESEEPMRAALQVALRMFRLSGQQTQKLPVVREIEIPVQLETDASIEMIDKRFTSTVFEPGGARDADIKRVQYTDVVPVQIHVIKLSPKLVQRIIAEVRLGNIVKLYFGKKTLTSSNPLVDAFVSGPGNGQAYYLCQQGAIPRGEDILHEQSVKQIRAQANRSVAFIKESRGDRKANIHCSLKIDPTFVPKS